MDTNPTAGEEPCTEPGCEQKVAWVRKTQFSGDHPYCEEHAKQEKDFGKEDPSYFYWKKV